MNLALVFSRGNQGIIAPPVSVEAHITNGFPRLHIVGLPETAVKESKERVHSAILNSGFDFPSRKIIINLAPADLPKQGAQFDLPIALGILAASKQIPDTHLAEYEFAGELALNGELRAIHGALPLSLATRNAKRKLILPESNAQEAALPITSDIYPASHLLAVCAHLKGTQLLDRFKRPDVSLPLNHGAMDFSDVQQQYHAKRALEIAAAGHHSVLMIGPPGTGKTMLASRFLTLLPLLTEDEALESAAIHSISTKGFDINTWRQRQFRNPHHSASSIALVGGGNPPKPGEISLAHHGVLFLDELPEFQRSVLETLREPLESGYVTISRAAYSMEFPAKFQLIAAMNPCPCGYLSHPQDRCQCTQDQIKRYQHRISGPLLDRIDMHLEVTALAKGALSNATSIAEKSEIIRKRVEKARSRQLERSHLLNGLLPSNKILNYCKLNRENQLFLDNAIEKLGLSARAHHRILRVARTIADLEDSDTILSSHLIEALNYRKLDRR